jgi:hypothetical protein
MNAGSETLPDIPRLSSNDNVHSHAAFVVKSILLSLFSCFALGEIAV